MIATLALALLAADGDPIRLATAPFRGRNVNDESIAFYVEHLVQQMSADGIVVTTPAEVEAVLGMERQRQLLGCDDGSNACLAEIAQALGVEGIVRGTLGLVEGTWQINIRVLSARDATPLAQYSGVASSDRALLDELAHAADSLRADVLRVLRARAEPKRGVGLRWVPLAAGVLMAALGSGMLVSAEGRRSALARGDLDAVGPNATAYADLARLDRGLGIAFASVGAVAVITGVVLLVLPAGTPKVSATVTPGGAAASLRVDF